MSLKTASYQPSNPTDEPIAAVLNINEPIDFYYPDGDTRGLKLYEGLFLCAIYIRRNASCAIYQAGTRSPVLEFDGGSLRAFQPVSDAMLALLDVLRGECADVLKKAAQSAAAAEAAANDSPEASPQTGTATVEASSEEPAAESPSSAEDPRANRFRRGRR